MSNSQHITKWRSEFASVGFLYWHVGTAHMQWYYAPLVSKNHHTRFSTQVHLKPILTDSLPTTLIFTQYENSTVYTPTRVLMGGSDSVAYCKSSVQPLFEDLLYNALLVWIDNLLGHAKSDGDRVHALSQSTASFNG
uniref:AlNc14C62G4491 protein n=1 Tax=Albugo laibachii Nc14 TaxID=890382 RepID=F0WCW3_9STRA|nr:AlNc14C62G4491 [Albugo laibachii Nc14]|eukprot:CCA19034.1 AlNc14C62G4491 [Albugo laibachii Nc14]